MLMAQMVYLLALFPNPEPQTCRPVP